jgi:hypothetical protein
LQDALVPKLPEAAIAVVRRRAKAGGAAVRPHLGRRRLDGSDPGRRLEFRQPRLILDA